MMYNVYILYIIYYVGMIQPTRQQLTGTGGTSDSIIFFKTIKIFKMFCPVQRL